jgi:hypothetical protein
MNGLITKAQVGYLKVQERATQRGEDTGDATQTAFIVVGGVAIATLVIGAITAYVTGKMGELG